MGYTSGWWSRADLIRHLKHKPTLADRRQSLSNRALQHELVLLASCYRGNAYRGVWWSVWEARTYQGTTHIPFFDDRYILCCVLKCYGGEWGYKDMTENMGPCYYSCPVGYLDMVPLGRFDGDSEWRAEVRRVNAEVSAKRQETRKGRADWYAKRRKAKKELAEARTELDRRKNAIQAV
jgi:hypothetical protein